MSEYQYTVELAGHVLRIGTKYLQTGVSLRDYIVEGKTPEISIEITERDIRREWTRMLENPRNSADFVNQLPGYYFESFALNRRVSDELLAFDTIAYHGSAIVIDSCCHIFSADSGTGKSTYSKMWLRHFGQLAYILNDDKPFLQLQGNRVIVFGSPWNGKHHYGKNISAPLRSISFLHRASKGSAEVMCADEGADLMRLQVFRPDREEDMEKALDLVKRISRCTAFYHVGFSLDPGQIAPVYNTLAQKPGQR